MSDSTPAAAILTRDRQRRSMLPALMLSTIVMRTQPDDQLAALAASGSDAAFEAIVQRYRRELMRYCTRLLLSDTRAEDVVQQALLSAWRALQNGYEVHHLRPWLYRITHNQTMNSLSRPGWDFEELSDSLAGGDALTEDLERRMMMRETLVAVAALPEAQREAILRTAVEGQSYATIAAEMGVTDTAVRGLVHRARVNLRTAAAAISPAPLVVWAARGARRPQGALGLLADALTTGGGAGATVGAGSAVLKSAVVAASSALVVGGSIATHTPLPIVSHTTHHITHPSHAKTSAAGSVDTSRTATAAAVTPAIASANGQPVALVARSSTSSLRPTAAGGTGPYRVSNPDTRAMDSTRPLRAVVPAAQSGVLVSSTVTRHVVRTATTAGNGNSAGERSAARSITHSSRDGAPYAGGGGDTAAPGRDRSRAVSGRSEPSGTGGSASTSRGASSTPTDRSTTPTDGSATQTGRSMTLTGGSTTSADATTTALPSGGSHNGGSLSATAPEDASPNGKANSGTTPNSGSTPSSGSAPGAGATPADPTLPSSPSAVASATTSPALSAITRSAAKARSGERQTAGARTAACS